MIRAEGDLISRQAVLDRTVNRNSIWNKITDSEGNNLKDILNSIPSTGNKGDLISRQAVDDVIAEIKSWYWQADRQALAKDPCVVDAMVDLFIRTIYKHIGKAERGG